MRRLHQFGQWEIQVDDDGSYRIVNLSQDGGRRFYQAISGKYGEPILVPEPDLGVTPPRGLSYIDAKGQAVVLQECISGIICKDASGAVVLRLSLTNAKEKGVKWTLDDSGRLDVDGQVFYLRVLVSKDKNRIKNYDAFFSETPSSGPVVFYELETLPVF